jgi:hypothetical protein
MYFPQENPIRVVSRPKLVGPGTHVGVQLPDGRVAHRTPTGDVLVSFHEFAQGRPVTAVRLADSHHYSAVMQRVAISVGRPADYRLVDNNCEHYANWLIGERPTSPQVEVVVLAAMVVALLRLGQA